MSVICKATASTLLSNLSEKKTLWNDVVVSVLPEPETRRRHGFAQVTDCSGTPVNKRREDECPASVPRPSLLPGSRRSCCSLGVVVVSGGDLKWRWGRLFKVCGRDTALSWTLFIFYEQERWEAQWWSPARRAQRKCQRRGEVCGLTCQWVGEVSSNLAPYCDMNFQRKSGLKCRKSFSRCLCCKSPAIARDKWARAWLTAASALRLKLHHHQFVDHPLLRNFFPSTTTQWGSRHFLKITLKRCFSGIFSAACSAVNMMSLEPTPLLELHLLFTCHRMYYAFNCLEFFFFFCNIPAQKNSQSWVFTMITT